MGQASISDELTKAIVAVVIDQQERKLQNICDLIKTEPSVDSMINAVKFAFKTFQNEVNLMASFVVVVLKNFDDGHIEYAVAEFLMESPDSGCYQVLLKSGLQLKTIWSLWRYTQILPQGTKYLFEAIVLRKNVCNEICCRHFMTSKKFPKAYEIVISTIQALDRDSFPALLYLLREFPLEPHNRNSFQMVFRALVLAGYKPSKDFIEKVINKSYRAVVFGNFESFGRWFKDYTKKVPRLTHLCRLQVRKNMKRNVMHGVTKLGVPESLQKYISLQDDESVHVIFKTRN